MDAFSKDQALVMVFMKKNIINNINTIMAHIMLKLLHWQLVIPGLESKQFTKRANGKKNRMQKDPTAVEDIFNMAYVAVVQCQEQKKKVLSNN